VEREMRKKGKEMEGREEKVRTGERQRKKNEVSRRQRGTEKDG
jgi:hypothetical protein